MASGQHFLYLRSVFLGYAALLLYLSLRPNVEIEGPVTRTDLVLHLGAYLVWTLLCLASGWFGRPFSGRNVALGSLLALVWSAASELAQGIPGLGRTVAASDALSNIVGVACGTGLASLMIAAPKRAGAGRRAEDRLGGAVRSISLLTLASRVLGLARDLLLVRVFGNSAAGSAFAAAFAIPNLFRRLFGEGALSAAFIPEYTKAIDEDPATADRFASLVVLIVAGVTGILLALGEFALAAVLFFTPEDPVRDDSLRLVMLLLPFMPLVCVTATLGGILHVHGRFTPTAAAPVVLNVALIAVGAIALINGTDPGEAAGLLGVAALVAGLLQTVWALWALRGVVAWSDMFEGVGARTRRTLTLFLPAVLGLGAIQLNSFVDTLIAMWPSWVGPTILGYDYPLALDANAILFFTQRLYQFPLGVFGIAVATAVFPLLSRAAGDTERFGSTLARGIRLSFFISFPASVGLVLVRTDLVDTLFGSGGERGFDASGAEQAAAVLLGYAWAVWAYAVNHVLTRAHFALGDTAAPARAALLMVGLNLVLNMTLIWKLGPAGLAWSTSIAATGQTVLLNVWLRRKLGGPLLPRPVRLAITHTVLSAGVMGVAVGLTQAFMEPGWVRLVASVAVGAVSFGGLSAALRRPELRWLLSRSADDDA